MLFLQNRLELDTSQLFVARHGKLRRQAFHTESLPVGKAGSIQFGSVLFLRISLFIPIGSPGVNLAWRLIFDEVELVLDPSLPLGKLAVAIFVCKGRWFWHSIPPPAAIFASCNLRFGSLSNLFRPFFKTFGTFSILVAAAQVFGMQLVPGS
jgi:hypothetical protein